MADKAPSSSQLLLDSIEPSPAASLQQHASIRILFVSDIPISPSSQRAYAQGAMSAPYDGLGVEAVPSSEGGPLRARVLQLMKQQKNLTHEQVKSGFPAASEYYRPGAKLTFDVQSTAASGVPLSLWENMNMYTRVAAVFTVVNGSCFSARHQLATVKALFQQRAYCNVIRRCIVFEGNDEMMSSLDRAVFRSVGIATASLEELVSKIMVDLASEIVHFYSHRARSLATSSSSDHVTTPIDRQSGRDTASKTIHSRACKQRGDLLLQLGAPAAALQTYLQAGPLDNVWSASLLEAIAAARYHDNKAIFTSAETIVSQLRRLRDGERGPAVQNIFPLEEIVQGLRARLEGSSIANAKESPIPSGARQRIAKEVEEPMLSAVRKLRPLLENIKTYIANDHGGEDDAQEELRENLRDALAEARITYNTVVSLCYAELELYVSEAYFSIFSRSSSSSKPLGDSQRLFGLEVESLLKLACLRAEQRNTKGLLDCLGTLSNTLTMLGCISAERALAIRRVIPDLCFQCRCYRKALYFLQMSASEDRQQGNIQHAVLSLLKGAQWCGIPLVFDESHGCFRTTSDFVVSSSSAVFGSPFQLLDSSGKPTPRQGTGSGTGSTKECVSAPLASSVRMQVIVLFEMLSALRMVQDRDERQWGMACHVAALLLFKYYDYIEDLGQQKLMFILQSCSVSLPTHLHPAIVSPPLVKAIVPQPLPPHLVPQRQHVCGVHFIRSTMENERFCFHGEILQTNIIWVVGEVATLRLHVTNPFLCSLQLSSLAMRCRTRPIVVPQSERGTEGEGGVLSSTATGESSTATHAHTSGMHADGSVAGTAAAYITQGVLLEPQRGDIIVASVLPQTAGILVIDAVDLRMGQFEFRTPITVSLPPIEIPVMPQMPVLTCSFNIEEIEIFSLQEYQFTATVHNVSPIAVDELNVSIHRPDCSLRGCDGCMEKASGLSIHASVDRSPLQSALPLGPGMSVALVVTVKPQKRFVALTQEFLIVRVEYNPSFTPPEPPRVVGDTSTPTFAPIPRRINDSRMRVFVIPSIEISDISLSADRRFLVVQALNACESHSIVVVPHEQVPFERQIPAVVLPKQEVALRFVIARIPHDLRKFVLVWHVQDRPDVHGVLQVDFTDHLANVRCTEPLEDAVISGYLTGADGEAPPSAAAMDAALPSFGMDDAVPPTWISLHEGLQPTAVPAATPILIRIAVSAPWATTVPLEVVVNFSDHDDGAVIAGPISSRWVLGAGCIGFDEEFEITIFTTGEHTLFIILRDEEFREIHHNWVFSADHGQVSLA